LTRRGIALLVLILGALFALTCDQADGHATLERSNPAADSLLAVPPREVVLFFTEPIDPRAITVTAVDERGRSVALGVPRLDPANDRRITVGSDDFSIGAYTVSWSNRSATDGHTLSGSFAFRVGGTDRAPAAATVEGERPPAWSVLLRWLAFLGVAPAIGSLIVAPGQVRRRIVVAGLAVAVIATALDPNLLAAFPPKGSVGGSVGHAVRAEPHGWWIRLAGFAVALVLASIPLVLSSIPVGENVRRRLLGAAGLVGVAGLALTSHAAGRDSYAWAATGIAFLHNATVALWVGALALIAAASSERWTEFRAFSRRALPLAVIAVAAGVANAGFIFPALETVTSTDYGRVLIAKVAVVLAVLALAGYHHLSLRRAADAIPRLLRQSVRFELGLIAVAIAIASTLALLAPPQESVGGLDRIDLAMPTSTELTTDQVFVRLTIDPARTGENALIVYATQGPPLTVETDASGAPLVVNHPALTDVQAVRIDLMSLDLPIAPRTIELQSQGDGRFRAEGVNLSADGWWRAAVAVRRTGVAEDATAEFILKTPDPNVAGFPPEADGGDPAAAEAYARARDQLASQAWASFSELLSGGNGGVELSQQVWSNGGFKISTPSLEMIRLGGKRYLLRQGNEWQVTEDSDPTGPAGWVAELDGATDIQFGNVETVNDRPAQIIHFFVPERFLAPAYYTWWVDLETGQILREAMISRSHYMIKRYDWSAPPEKLVPPV
jgi:copper transport protein